MKVKVRKLKIERSKEMQRNAPWVMATWGELFYSFYSFFFWDFNFNFGRKITGELIDYGGGSQFCWSFLGDSFGFSNMKIENGKLQTKRSIEYRLIYITI